MTGKEFHEQMARLHNRFGAKNFDQSFTDLVWKEIYDLPGDTFRRAVDVWIGSRLPNKPPLLPDFRDARLAHEKRRFDQDARGATQSLTKRAPEETRNHLRMILSKEVGGVDSAAEALEVAKLRRQAMRADGKDPDGGPDVA